MTGDSHERPPLRVVETDDGTGALARALLDRAAGARLPDPMPGLVFERRLSMALARPRRSRWPALAGLALVGTAVAFVAMRPTDEGVVRSRGARVAHEPPPRLVTTTAPVANEGVENDAPGSDARATETAPHRAPCSPPTDPAIPSVCSATYLGGEGPDRAEAVAFAPDGSVLVGGIVTAAPPGVVPRNLGPGGPGAVVRLSADGRQALGMLRLGREVTDMEVDASTGKLVVVGDFGVAVVTADLGAVVFHRALGSAVARRISAAGGVSAVLTDDGIVHVFAADGSKMTAWSQGAGTARDIAIDAVTRSVFVAGFVVGQASGLCDGPLPSAYLRSFTYDGALKWRNYDWSAGHVVVEGSRRCRHTRANLIAVGRDGKLYMAGESYGPDSPFSWDPRDTRKPAPNLVVDGYTDPAGSSHRAGIGYLARFARDTGAIEAGQFLLTRSRADAPAPLEIEALDVDERGQVLLGGNAGCCLPGRDQLTFAGVSVLSVNRSEGWAALLPPSWRGRTFWTTWSGSGTAAAKAVALRDGRAAIAATQRDPDPARTLIVKDAIQGSRGGGSDLYLGVMRLH